MKRTTGPSKSDPANRDLVKAIKKISGGRITAGAVEAAMEAVPLLALGDRFDDALRILRWLAASPKEVRRLVVDDDRTYFSWYYHRLAAVAASPSLMKELGLSRRDVERGVEEARVHFRTQRAYYLADPGSSYGATRKTTKMVREIAQHLAKKAPAKALPIARALASMPIEHWTLRCEHLLVAANVAFAAGEEEEAVRFAARAAEEHREGSYGLRWAEVETLLEFDFSARALARGALRRATLDDKLVTQVTAAVEKLLGGSSRSDAKVDWPAELKRLSGARSLAKGASKADVASLEKRLKKQLPKDYRALLQASNGVKRSTRALALWSTSEVQWFRATNKDWIDAYVKEGAQIPHLADTLQISEANDGEVYLLNPKVETKSGCWEAWHFANYHPGEQRYESLAQMIDDLSDADR